MKQLLALTLCLISLSVAAQDFIKPLSDLDHRLNDPHNRFHNTLLPFHPGHNRIFDALLDSASTGDAYRDRVEIELGGDVQGGFANNGFLASLAPKVGLSWNKGNRFYIRAQYQYFNEILPEYLDYFVDSLRVLPGVGFASSSPLGWQSHMATGSATFNANKYFSFEVGRGKQFWGDGYRSLIMSHNSSPYPYARISTEIWNIKYVSTWAQMRDISATGNFADSRLKYMALHALNWNIGNRFSAGFYEMVVWQSRDTLSDRGLDFNYLNPIIFFRPIEFAQGSADNVLVGMNWKWKVGKHHQLYGQILLDEFLLAELRAQSGWWANKWGFQFGYKAFDAFTPGLHILTEFNAVRPFTYTHGSVLQNYGHMNQGLAHPLGANFAEWLTQFRYAKDDWEIENSFIWAIFGRDRDGNNMGGNIFRSYAGPFRQYDNYMAQGLKSTLHFNELTFRKKISKVHNLSINASYQFRYEVSDAFERTDHIFLVGLSTSPWHRYKDF